MKVFAVIVDLEGSRRIDPGRRPLLQRWLRAAARRVQAGSNAVSPYTVTLGDELQAVYAHPAGVLRDYFRLRGAMVEPAAQEAGPSRHGRRDAVGDLDLPIRLSIAYGDLTTPLNRLQAIGMDGPAFHEARAGIEQLRSAGEIFCLRGSGKSDLERQAIRWMGLSVADWSPSRWQIARHALEGRSPQQIARKLAVSAANVYKVYRAAHIGALMDLIAVVEGSLAVAAGLAKPRGK